LGKQLFQVGEGVLNHRSVAGILAGLHLIKEVGPGKLQGLFLPNGLGVLRLPALRSRSLVVRPSRFHL
jgi:hypothetical protein